MIAIIDYGMGNVRSVANAVNYCGYDFVITDKQQDISAASHVIVPGVGAFGDAMKNLRERGLPDVLTREVIEKGKPTLGICLGMQVMARSSTEHGLHSGLGWFDADVVRIEPGDRKLKIPHVGWNVLDLHNAHPLLSRFKPEQLTFYFVHSYHMRCDRENDILATVDYGGKVTAVVSRDNIVAAQFHPEKSQDSGVELLTEFLRWKP